MSCRVTGCGAATAQRQRSVRNRLKHNGSRHHAASAAKLRRPSPQLQQQCDNSGCRAAATPQPSSPSPQQNNSSRCGYRRRRRGDFGSNAVSDSTSLIPANYTPQPPQPAAAVASIAAAAASHEFLSRCVCVCVQFRESLAHFEPWRNAFGFCAMRMKMLNRFCLCSQLKKHEGLSDSKMMMTEPKIGSATESW